MHSNIFIIWFVVFIIFLSSYTAFSDHDYRYSNCSQLFSCGNLTNIGYPFWGEARPSYCGAPGYKLQCRNGLVPEIQINSLTYQISRINLTNLIMRITRTDFIDNKQCPSSFNNGSAIDSNLFKYALTNTNLTLFYGNCTPRPGVAALYQFRCNNSVGDSIIGYGFRELPRIVPNCRVTIGVLVAEEAFGRFMSRDLRVDGVLKEGFEVGFVRNASFCDGCEGSGGRCGFDFDVKQPTCFCQDGVYKGGKCPNNTATGNATGTQSPPGDGDHKRGVKIAIAASVAGTLMVFIGIAILCYLRRKGLTEHCFTCCLRTRTRDAQKLKFKELLRDHQMLAPKIFKYSDLKKITNSFQDKLGQGGYGSVFKGQLPDGRLVAVKILSETKGNGEEFINEVASISRTSHINIVPLLGFCIQGRKRALVYEFMPNGSLEKFIFIKGVLSEANKLEWDALYKIAIGTARGLEYLHRGCHTRIVHFDIKPHNILLDQDFCPKISDFGLAKLCFKKDSIVSIKGTRGTIGYIAPELVSRNFGGVSHKSDVYSYGMMVLEMVGGRKNVDVNVDNTSEIYFPHWIYKQLDHCEDLGLCRAVTEEEREIARKMTIVGLWCIQIDPLNRPSMNEVLDMLEGSVEDLQIPPKPYLSSPPRPNQVSSTTSMS